MDLQRDESRQGDFPCFSITVFTLWLEPESHSQRESEREHLGCSEGVGVAHQVLLVVQGVPHGSQRNPRVLSACLDKEDHSGAQQDGSHDGQEDCQHYSSGGVNQGICKVVDVGVRVQVFFCNLLISRALVQAVFLDQIVVPVASAASVNEHLAGPGLHVEVPARERGPAAAHLIGHPTEL